MPYRKKQFANGEIYHIVIRGIDGNTLFKDVDDYYRGVFSIYEFNNTKPVVIRDRRKARSHIKKLLKKFDSDSSLIADHRDRLVDVLGFCFMSNHLHLLLRQIKDGGIVKFMAKIGTGYGGYFNRKYRRKGYVFQDRFAAVSIQDDNQLKTVFIYIHSNPISLIEPSWKESGIGAPEKVIKFLENYKWSSYRDYIGEKNFPSVTERTFILETMNNEKGCRELIEDWVGRKGEIKKFNKRFPKIVLE